MARPFKHSKIFYFHSEGVEYKLCFRLQIIKPRNCLVSGILILVESLAEIQIGKTPGPLVSKWIGPEGLTCTQKMLEGSEQG